MRPQGAPAVELELHLVDEATLAATAVGSGVSHVYTPAGEPPGCE